MRPNNINVTKYKAMFAIDNYNFEGKRAIIRVDFNVPLNAEGKVTAEGTVVAGVVITSAVAGGLAAVKIN